MGKSCLRLPFGYMISCRMLSRSSSKDIEEDGSREKIAKPKPKGWKCMPYIIGNESFEKAASVGLLANFTVYLVKRYNVQQVSAANMTNIFFGTTNFAPLLGAFVSDAYLGRYRTLAYSSVISFLGMLTLTLSAFLPQLRPPTCSAEAQLANQCVQATGFQMGFLYFVLLLLIIGAAGVRPCSLPFGVDQFDVRTEDGERGRNSFFNWYYFTSTASMLVSLIVIVYIQNSISWVIGFAIPSVLMLLAVVAFFLGTKIYVMVAPEGSVFGTIAYVSVAAFKKRHLELLSPDDVQEQELVLYNPPNKSETVLKLPLSLQFRFLHKAAIITDDSQLGADGETINPWRLCSIQQVEEVKCLLRIVPIWSAGIIGFMALVQQFTFAILQALTMDRHVGPKFQIPAGYLAMISMVAVAVFIPIYDRLMVPLLRRVTKVDSGLTLLQRQGVGLFVASVSMVVAAIVERRRRESALSHGGMSPMSVFWLMPQLSLMGIGEVFNAIGQIEFYNRQFPEHMQTLANSLFSCTVAGASYLSTLLVMVIRKITEKNGTNWLENNINHAKVDYFYYLIAILGLGNLLYFLVCAHYYRYKAEAIRASDSSATELDCVKPGNVVP